MESTSSFNSISVHPHHIKQNICGTRAKYREGRKDTAVKVYTVNQESVYLLITGVPAVGGAEELRALCDQYGIVEEFQPLDDYPCEEFTEVYYAKYKSFPAARTAKKCLDDKSFFGGVLHVFYAPEFESILETKVKLQERRKYVAWKIRTRNPSGSTSQPKPAWLEQKSKPNSIPSTSTLRADHQIQQPVTYVWAGKEYTVYPTPSSSGTSGDIGKRSERTPKLFVPRQLKTKCIGEQTLTDVGGTLSQISSKNASVDSHANLSNVDESSYLNTISHVRGKVSNVSVPNMRVSLKRKRRV